MIACLTDAELSFGSFTLSVLRREAEPALQRMAGRILAPVADEADPELQKRLQAMERLKQTWKELSRPLGGKWWKTREELYDA